LQVPYEEGAYWRKGSKEGPAAIVNLLKSLRPQSLRTTKILPLPIESYLAPPLQIGPYDRDAAFAEIGRGVTEILDQGHAPFVLGGDHSLTYPVVRSLVERYGAGSFSVLHVDAHSDTFPATDGYDYHHGAVFRKIVEDALLDAEDIHQVGVRGLVPAGAMAFASERGYDVVSAAVFRSKGSRLDALELPSGKPWYVSLDIDAVDPAFAPGTGTPVPGGLSSAELLDLIDQISHLPVVGMDLVEVAPIYDPAGITTLLAAHAVMEMLIASPFVVADADGRR
jgi:agmatinase